MNKLQKDQQAILKKLNIAALNKMQLDAQKTILAHDDVILLSPTGSGKTLAFLLPILAQLDPNCTEIQTLILTPSRELAIQIEQVIREMGTGFKANAVYGGRAGSKDRIELKHKPAILIGTPGRVADHIRRGTFTTHFISTFVLDEFDKSLEIGFEDEMVEIAFALKKVKKRILTSATNSIEIPRFIRLNEPKTLNYLTHKNEQLELVTVLSPAKDKLKTLVTLLKSLEDKPGIIFCNYKDTINWVSNLLQEHNIAHGCFYGGLEQQDRERALIKFRNGTHKILLATDLAARGIDVPEIEFIMHYQLPHRKEEFTHRNGRTARMMSDGTAYILRWEKENLPDFIVEAEPKILYEKDIAKPQNGVEKHWQTLFISGGRKDKISKGDIAGLFFKQGNLTKEELGVIEIKQDCAFVSVEKSKAEAVCEKLNNSKLKKKKVRISLA